MSSPCGRLSIDGQAFNDKTTRSIWGINLSSPVIEYVTRASIATSQDGDVIYDLLIDDDNGLVLVFEAPVYYNKLDFLLVNTYSSWVNEEHDIYNLLVFLGARWAKLLLAVEHHNSKSAEFILHK